MEKILYKSPSDSEIIKTEVVCPNDTNLMGLLQGGRLVEWLDIALRYVHKLMRKKSNLKKH